MDQQRQTFRTTQDWHNYLNTHPGINGQQLQDFRFACYKAIEELRGRPLLVYYTKFIEASLPNMPNSIDLSDIDGFTDLVNSIKIEKGNKKEIDILIHSPGGRADATERIVNIIRNKFDIVNFLIPHSAYSAATMLALSGDSITLHPSATLGPIDPQINGIPSRSIKRGFENVKEKIKKDGPESLPAYIPLLEKYSLDLLEQCEDAEKLSKELVAEWLKLYMFKDDKECDEKIAKAVEFFSDYDEHKTHARPLYYKKLSEYGLKIELAEGELVDLLWEAHLLLNGFFNASPFVKLFENRYGISWGKQQMQMPIPMGMLPFVQPNKQVSQKGQTIQ